MLWFAARHWEVGGPQKSIGLTEAQKKTLLRHRRYFFSTLEMLTAERKKTEADLAVSPEKHCDNRCEKRYDCTFLGPAVALISLLKFFAVNGGHVLCPCFVFPCVSLE